MQRLLNHLLESIGRFHLESEAASYRSGGNQSKDEQRLTAILHGKSDTAGCETHVEIGHCRCSTLVPAELSCMQTGQRLATCMWCVIELESLEK